MAIFGYGRVSLSKIRRTRGWSLSKLVRRLTFGLPILLAGKFKQFSVRRLLKYAPVATAPALPVLRSACCVYH